LTCDAALNEDPDLLSGLINRAAALNSLGRYREAAATAERGATQDGGHPYILTEMATAYWKLGKFSKARSCAKRALERDPQFEPARRLLDLIHRG
jgi:tetratricopeptide (TPR) repeat protein